MWSFIIEHPSRTETIGIQKDMKEGNKLNSNTGPLIKQVKKVIILFVKNLANQSKTFRFK